MKFEPETGNYNNENNVLIEGNVSEKPAEIAPDGYHASHASQASQQFSVVCDGTNNSK